MPAKHLNLGIEARHFAAWLQLWSFNCSSYLKNDEAREMIALAHEVGKRLKNILHVESPAKTSFDIRATSFQQ